jgi:DNA (cytosine-5)-methyltransferase 1
MFGVEMNKKQYKVLDLFAGAGGFSYGFKKFEADGYNPFIIVGAVEIDIAAAETFIASLINDGVNSEKAKKIVITDDITKKETKESLYHVCPKADIIIGGPPCQSFSLIGPRSGDADKKARFANDCRDNLFSDYVEIVDHYKPRFFVFENVKGIASKKDGNNNKYVDLIVSSFEEIGYKLDLENQHKKYILLNAAEYGVPQLRERFFLIGNNMGLMNPVPEKTHCGEKNAEARDLKPFVTIREAIGDLPFLQPKITMTRDNRNNKQVSEAVWIESIESENKKRFSGEDPMEYGWHNFTKHYNNCSEQGKNFLDFINPVNKNAMLTGHTARSHQLTDIKLFEGMPEGSSSADLCDSNDSDLAELAGLIKYKMDSFRDKYKKMTWDKPSLTVFAHLQKDGNRFIHPDSRQGRTLTVRESARLQSFPDDYEFRAIGNMRFKHIGNAVPPILAMTIAKAIYGAFK